MTLSEEQKFRYARHLVLNEIREEGQKKLLSSKVLVIGAGGLGSAALLYLASAGVGTLGIADDDCVELHNLQRQIIHSTERLGMEKVRSAEASVCALNPDVKVNLYPIRIAVDNILPILAEYDFILDCTDRFETKFLINDACVLAKKPYCHAGVVRFEGQVMTYFPGEGPCLRCLLGAAPNGSTCAQVGVLGAAVGILGSIQALEAVKYLLGIGELLVGRVLYFDGLKMGIRIVNFSHANPDCAVCGTHPTILSLQENRTEYEGRCKLF